MRACDNPLNSTALSSLIYQFPEGDELSILRQFEEQGHRGALVGPEGSGKSTLLLGLEKRFRERCFETVRIVLHPESLCLHAKTVISALSGLRNGSILIIDGAEQLTPIVWRIICLAAPRLLITSHREGLLPTLYRCRTTEALMEQLLIGLLGERAESMKRISLELFRLHDGNIRNVLWSLYDRMH